MTRGVRPPEAGEDFVELDCSNPNCQHTTWVPPGAEDEVRGIGGIFMPVCSAACATVLVNTVPGVAGYVDAAQPSLGHVIDKLWAYVAEDQDGEGVIGMPVPGMGNVPLVGADADRMLSYRPYAQQAANLSGRKVKLVRFEARVEVEDLLPQRKPHANEDH